MTRVLLADDHPMIRTALEVLLRDTSYELAGCRPARRPSPNWSGWA
jgi:DNA-binding NarL/FixJ family response regulator